MHNRLLFAHLPKCAGSTFSKILIDYSNPNKILQLQPKLRKAQISGYLSLPQGEKEKYDLILGHHAYGIRDQIPGKVDCITMLRNPLDRVVSYYDFILHRRNHRLHKHLVASGMSLTEFLTSGMSSEIENQMTVILARTRRNKIQKNPKFFLEQAVKNLEEDFIHVGLVEQFDTSLIMLKNILGWSQPPYYLRENIRSKSSGKRESVDPVAVEIIREMNQVDEELYTYAVQRFNEEANRKGDELAAEVKKFKQENQKFSEQNVTRRKLKKQLSEMKNRILGN